MATDWDREADIVVIGSGATGLPAAIVAREAGASVIVVEAQEHIGGHAITCGGNLPLGGGNSLQKKYGIADSPDLFFQDLTDWSVVETNGFPVPLQRSRDRPRFRRQQRAGIRISGRAWRQVRRSAARRRRRHEIGVSAPRTMHFAVDDWPMVQTGEPADPRSATLSPATG